MRGLIALLMLAATPAAAQTPPPARPVAISPDPDPATLARVDELRRLIGGTAAFDSYFAPAFKAAVSKEKWDAIVAQLTAQLGKPAGLPSFIAASPWSGTARLRFERGVVNVKLAVDPAAPHQVTGLLFAGVEVAGDTFDKLVTDFRALPGESGLLVQWLDNGVAPNVLAAYNAGTPAPLGSAFKLWVLGELARSVTAGGRKWADVIPVGPPSLPSGMMQSWPAASPVTLQTLATMMISISDNTATDTLVTAEGIRLDKFVADIGTPGLAPVLTTRQMFAIKSPANADLAARWAATWAPKARRALLDANAKRLAETPLDVNMFSGKPVAIDTLEWFASPGQTVAVLDYLRGSGGETALAILAVNPGADAATRARFDYVGFKGGSEPGVITLNYLVRRKDGRWLAIVGNWRRRDAGVDTNAFAQLMNRALVLAATATAPAQ